MNPNERFDDIDIMIMKMVHDNGSVREMSAAVGRGISTVHNRLENLEGAGLVAPPPKKQMHRSRALTEQGKFILSANRIITFPE
jgi:transposase